MLEVRLYISPKSEHTSTAYRVGLGDFAEWRVQMKIPEEAQVLGSSSYDLESI